jgi:penicillin-binding protein 1A
MTNMLKTAVENGSGCYAKNLGKPCAGKTGTSNDSSDAWFIGYTPQLVAGVWVGYDNRSTPLGNKITGAAIACPIWTYFMQKTLENEPVLHFAEPEDIEWNLIDLNTGLLASAKTHGTFLEAFIKGTAPTKYSTHSNLDYQRQDLIAEE